MNITLEHKYLKIVDGRTIILREGNLVDCKLRTDYVLIETDQVNTPQHIRIYPSDVTIPTNSGLADLYTQIRGYYDSIKNEPLAT